MNYLAKYPNGFILIQMHIPYCTQPVTARKIYRSDDRDYLKAIDHYKNVLAWCKEMFVGPYILNEQDILYYGIRVRIGSLQDQFLFKLKWG